ncbi:HNH endonuclease [Microbacterium sp. LTA6]|uniref:HNH endonuclease signature motif containing protein n=1 Tax=Microbacterium sp. LTA6 TaxID=3129771 RepID=UPI0032537C7C
MNSPDEVLEEVVSDLSGLVRADSIVGLSDAEKLAVLRRAGEALRLLEAVVVETVSSVEPGFEDAFGCRSMNELLQRALLTDASGASRVVKAARAVEREISLVSGERLPARWPALRDAMLDGGIGVAGLLAATGALDQAADRIGVEDRLRADTHLAGYARGFSAEASDAGSEPQDLAPPATPDDLRQASQYLAMVLDPDGAEPTDRDAQHQRYLTIGRIRNGVHPLRGDILPDTAAQLQLIMDAQSNPKVGGAPAPGVAFRPTEEALGDDADEDPFNADPRNVIEPRTAGQKRHDALAAALGIAARHHDMPTLAGAAPTLVVHVDAKDYAAGTGWATIPGGDTSVPLSVAAHTGCTGTIQRVLFDEGRIIGITVIDRVFTVHQRRAIIARDKECLIPGCHVSASWCEIHHVTEHARGGPTHTDNGVPLCWWHHRSLDHSGWEIRMANGVPQIRGPAWWDPDRAWRTPRSTRTPLRVSAMTSR